MAFTNTLPSDFGDLGKFALDQHMESTKIYGQKLVLQTSGSQSGDGEQGTWSARLSNGQGTHFPWCGLEEARAKAIAWAKETIAADG